MARCRPHCSEAFASLASVVSRKGLLVMARGDHAPTTKLGPTACTPLLLDEWASRGFFDRSEVRCPPLDEIEARPEADEVVVYRDFFVAGLRFPMEDCLLDAMKRLGVYFHQITPNAVLRLSVFMWVCRTMGVVPSADAFLRSHAVHHQPKYVDAVVNDKLVKYDAQYACLNFKYASEVDSPVTAYRNKWVDWNKWWFYFKIGVPEGLERHPLSASFVGQLPPDSSYKVAFRTAGSGGFLDAFAVLAKEYSTRDLVEEYCAVQCFPVRRGWDIGHWAESRGAILVPDFGKCFGFSATGALF